MTKMYEKYSYLTSEPWDESESKYSVCFRSGYQSSVIPHHHSAGLY